MEADKLKKVEEIFHTALELRPAERRSFLEESCGDDEELRREVKSLLAVNKTSNSIFETPLELLAAEMFSNRQIRSSSLVKQNLGQYKITKLLGKGGMGEVYLAQDTKLDRWVALKILPAEFAENAHRMSRFVREAKAASALNHPNILTIYEIGESDGMHFIATEFIDGQTLNEYAKSKPLNFKSALQIAIQIASALEEAHLAGVVHRDIKPDNVMIRPNGLAKILDFGIAKMSGASSALADGAKAKESATAIKDGTNPGMIMGTANYMSPEQAKGKAVDARTDIFSFGIVLYEMLSGKLPFQGDSAMDTIGAILYQEPVSLNQLLLQLPGEIESIVTKTLFKNPDKRYQTTTELLTDLQRVKQRLDYEEVGRSFLPEKLKVNSEGKATKILDPSDFARINSMENEPPNNLSGKPMPIIGREAETAEIMNLLCQPETRLLTVTGVGGTGKTRLATTISYLSLREFADGVYFIGLAQIENDELVVPIIAQTLGIREESGKSLIECLCEHLNGKKILLVLDNFEQITKAALSVGELLADSPDLKILVTSRVRLNLKLENEFTLQPLGFPANEKQLSANEFGKFPAIKLFVKRARAVKSDFALTEENAASIGEICRRVDGLPLAIELAAVRVKLFSPAAILKRLEKSLDMLTGGAKDLPERQQTMRGAIRWSYDLLDADEKKLFNRLSVFRSGLTLEGAEAIGNAEQDLNFDLLNVISSLVDNSLLSHREQKNGEPRFRMLVVVREFAFEKLVESSEADEIKRRHAEFYAALSETAEADLLGANAAEWMETFEREHDNLRSALVWTLEHQPETAVSIVGIIYRFWLRRGYSTEGRKWICAALEKSSDRTNAALRAKATRGGGLMSLQQGDFEAANFFIEESLRLSREVGDKSLVCYALTSLGAIRVGEGNLTAARELTEECLAIAREIDDKFQISVSLNRLGDMARQKEDYHSAWNYCQEAFLIAKEESISAALPIFAHNLASIACLLDDLPAALLYNLESLKYGQELGHKNLIGSGLNVFAALAVKSGKAAKAAQLFGAAQSIYEANSYKLEKADQDFNDRFINEARAAIGDKAFEAASAEGRQLSISEAMTFARPDESEPLPNFVK